MRIKRPLFFVAFLLVLYIGPSIFIPSYNHTDIPAQQNTTKDFTPAAGNFGNDHAGSSYTDVAANDIVGGKWTLGGVEQYTDTILFYGRSPDASPHNGKAIICDSSLNIVAVGDESSISNSNEWQTLTFSSNVTLEASTPYYLGLISDFTARVYYDDTGDYVIDTTNSYASPTDPTDGGTDTTREYSIYAVTYDIPNFQTLTLRPDGDIWTNLTRSSGSFNYEMVDEATHDSDGTTVYRTVPPFVWDRYTLEDHTTELGPITNLTVYYYAKRVGTGTGYRAHGIADSSDDNASSSTGDLTLSYVQYSETYFTKPSGGVWTWSEVDNAEVLLGLGGTPVPSGIAYCTQIYVNVSYEAEEPAPEWNLLNPVELVFSVGWDPTAQFGYDMFFIVLGLIMIPASTMYLVRGGRKEMSTDKLFFVLILFLVGIGLVIGGVMP